MTRDESIREAVDVLKSLGKEDLHRLIESNKDGWVARAFSTSRDICGECIEDESLEGFPNPNCKRCHGTGDTNMTRDEQIREANPYDYDLPFNDFPAEHNANIAFEEGTHWADSHPADRWVSVEDRLPEIIYAPDGSVNSVLAYKKDFVECGSDIQVINTVWANKNPHLYTHWQPLPEAPK